MNEAAALTALVRERSLEKFAAQLQREELVERRVVFFIEKKNESLIKSWSTWDLARLAPEQANYLDWFLKGVGFL